MVIQMQLHVQILCSTLTYNLTKTVAGPDQANQKCAHATMQLSLLILSFKCPSSEIREIIRYTDAKITALDKTRIDYRESYITSLANAFFQSY